ncbi:MAG: hypothetical protein ACHQF4_09745, partial [Sphingobacteriales bacterium]
MNLIAKIDYSNTFVSGTQVNGEVYITLYDASSGQPANGNNVVVSYEENINGSVADGQATIAGQSAAIYTGLISDTDPSRFYFTKFQITNIGTIPNPQPPVNACDLLINSINVDNPESAPGAADGQITIIARSSYGPVNYSLDNVNFQASPIFTNLTGGVKTGYVTDANGCTANSVTTVPIQSNLLVSDPSITLTGGNVSRWSAAFNPIVFTYQRKDFEVTSITLDTVSGNAAVSVNCDTTAIKNAIISNNQAIANAAALNVVLTNISPVYVYLNAGSYTGTFQVLSVSGSGSLVINTPHIANATGFANINLLRPYYQVRTQI